MNFKKLLYTCLLMTIAQTRAVEKRSENQDTINKWYKICNKFSKLDKTRVVIKTFCKANKLALEYEDSKGDYRHLEQIQGGTCKDIKIMPYGRTEICSSSGYRLYWKKTGALTFYGCYNYGKPNDKSFTECCQLYSNGGVYMDREFCSGPMRKDYEAPKYEGTLDKAYRTYAFMVEESSKNNNDNKSNNNKSSYKCKGGNSYCIDRCYRKLKDKTWKYNGKTAQIGNNEIKTIYCPLAACQAAFDDFNGNRNSRTPNWYICKNRITDDFKKYWGYPYTISDNSIDY
ncbi:hypothetical protein H8356DRAFT_1747715 [Neocallimastix lanati (nom. inval.)]|nr:hypothetical protein H8356DRAFT_1747715 [Neocallimastix sp. JGI-2020a]